MHNLSDRIYNKFKNLIITPATGKADPEAARKIILIHALTLIGIIYLAGFGLSAWCHQAYRIVVLDFSCLILISANLVFLRRTGRSRPCIIFGVAAMALFFLEMFYTGGVKGTGFMWLYCFPLFATFLLGARYGLLTAGALLLVSGSFFIFKATSFFQYPPAFFNRFVFSYLAVTLFSYTFEKSRAQAQADLEKARQQEEQKVADRTRQLKAETEKREALATKLRRAQKMEALGMMSGGVAHDLNNLLTGVLTYPDLLLFNLPPDSPMVKPLQAIKTSGEKAAAVVADLLTVARGANATHRVIEVKKLIYDLNCSPEFTGIRELYPEINWRFPVLDKSPAISCSEIHVHKCLLNLALNAAEAIEDHGEIAFNTFQTIPEHPEAEAGVEYVVLEVKDNGPGIPAADLENIFEPFFTKKAMGRSGTGLGLAVVWNTMQDHDGFVTVEGSAAGTCFRLFFPRGTDPQTTTAGKKLSMAALKGQGRILVVDDEAGQRELVQKSLGLLGYQVFEAKNGETALQMLPKQPVDLVILDMLMGAGLNGRETYAEIIKIYPRQKALIVSGYAESEDVLAAIQMGAGAFLEKPYSIDKLGEAVQRELLKPDTSQNAPETESS